MSDLTEWLEGPEPEAPRQTPEPRPRPRPRPKTPEAPVAEAAPIPPDSPDAPAEERLARLAAAVGPLRRVLAAIAGALLANRAYERLCYARLGDYARERAGCSVRQLQDLARVHRALTHLPALERALLRNELPWSKVRLVARVATAENEAAWIERARALPTRRLEQVVREEAAGPGPESPDLDPALDEGLPERPVSLRCTPAVREKWLLVREIAERVAGQRLRAADALELVTAEVCSGVPLDPALARLADEPPPRARDARPDTELQAAVAASTSTTPRPRAPARHPCPELTALAEGLTEADAFELDRRLRRAIRLEQTLDAAISGLLRCVASAEYEWRGDFQTLPRYARDELGMSASKARALLRLERAADVCPELREAYRSGRLSWVKAQALLPLLRLDIAGEWRPVWVAWAERVTVRRLAEDVERALLLRAAHDRAWQRCQLHPERAQDPIPPDEQPMCAPDVDPEATQELRWRLPWDVAGLFEAVRETLRSRLAAEHGRRPTDGETFEAMLDDALVAWTLREPGARRPDPVIERDGYRCAVPGCSSRRSLHDHHIEFRSAGGSDAPANRITLCAFHHQRCLHAGRLRVRGRAPDALVFELGLRTGSPPLARYRSGDISLPIGAREMIGARDMGRFVPARGAVSAKTSLSRP